MATEVLPNLANALSQRFAPKLAIQTNTVGVLLSKMPTKAGFGKNVAFDAEMDGGQSHVGSRAEGAPFSPSDYTFDVDLPATLSWAEYAGAVSISDMEVNAALSSEGTATELMSILEHRLVRKAQWLASKLNQDAINGTGTDGSGNPNLIGLFGGALLASGSYANIDRGTYPLWAGNVLSNGGVARPLTADLLNQLLQNIFIDANELPNEIIMDPYSYRQYKKLFNPLQRVVSADGQPAKFDAGVASMSFEGIPISQDKDFTPGTLVALNTRTVSKVYLPSRTDSVSDVWKSAMMEAEGSDGLSVVMGTGIPLILVPLARTGTASNWAVYTQMQIECTRANANGIITDISVV